MGKGKKNLRKAGTTTKIAGRHNAESVNLSCNYDLTH